MKDFETKFDTNNIQSVELNLLDGFKGFRVICL